MQFSWVANQTGSGYREIGGKLNCKQTWQLLKLKHSQRPPKVIQLNFWTHFHRKSGMAFQNSLTLFFVICFTLSYIFGPTVGFKITHPCLGKAVHSKTNHKMIQFLAKTAKKHHVFQPMLTALLLMHDVE